MAWVKIDDHFYDHPRWAEAPGDSIALWLASMAWCNRNDSRNGFIPEAKTRGLVAIRNPVKTCADLVQRGGFRRVKGGYIIHNYEIYQQPERLQEIREKRSASGKKGAAARWGERARAAEYYDAPPPEEPLSDDSGPVANGMANAISFAIDVASRVATPVASAVATKPECPVTRIPVTRSTRTAAAATYTGDPPDPAAAAFEIYVQHRIRVVGPDSPIAFAAKVRADDPPKFAGQLNIYLATNPDADAIEIAENVYDLGPIDLIALGHTPTRSAP